MNLPMSSSLEDVDGPRVVMLGPPGSGKGTHARLLAERFNIPHLSTGALLRREMAAGSSLGVRVAAAVDAGQLVDDAAIIDLVRTAITSPAALHGWILDGAPRSVEQAQLLTPVFEAAGGTRIIAIALDVPEAELRHRLAERRTREGRSDDAPEIISQRFGVWATTGQALLAWYERSGMLQLVNGTGSVQDVASRVIAAVELRCAREIDNASP
jgi:adenylate kinase